MKLWKNPRLAAALCAVMVLVCAAAPAVFLSVVDAASLGHSQAVADPYTAPTPTADDYYLLRQLSARQLTQSKYTFQPGDTGQERKPRIYYHNPYSLFLRLHQIIYMCQPPMGVHRIMSP